MKKERKKKPFFRSNEPGAVLLTNSFLKWDRSDPKSMCFFWGLSFRFLSSVKLFSEISSPF